MNNGLRFHLVFEEIKGTGNMEINLDRHLELAFAAAKPPPPSGTSAPTCRQNGSARSWPCSRASPASRSGN